MKNIGPFDVEEMRDELITRVQRIDHKYIESLIMLTAIGIILPSNGKEKFKKIVAITSARLNADPNMVIQDISSVVDVLHILHARKENQNVE
jgi:hypothetical protein